MLTFEEFIAEGKRQQAIEADACEKIGNEIKGIIIKQDKYLEDMCKRVRQFETACSVVEGQSKVYSAVKEAERLSAEIAQLQRTEKYLSSAVDIENSKALLDRLELLGWPKPIDPSCWQNETMTDLLSIFDSFLIFSSKCGEESNLTGRAIRAMIEPIKIRFQFHFATEQPTNRLDKPEWYLGHVQQIIQSHRSFIENCLEINDVNKGLSSITVLETFVNRLVDILKEHLLAREARIVGDSFIFLHTVSELLSFIKAIKEMTNVDCSRLINSFLGTNLSSWISAEKEASVSSYTALCEESPTWDEEEIDSPNHVAGSVARFIELMGDLIETLFSVPMMHAKIEFLANVIVPLFNSFYAKIEFELPAFHGTVDDVLILILQANSIFELIETVEFSWGSSLEAMELANSSDFKDHFGYDATDIPGTIFNKVLVAFQELSTRIQDNIFSFIWESFYSSASSFVRAMHYGIIRDNPGPLSLHDDLRKSLIKVTESINMVKPLLRPAIMEQIESRLLTTLSTFLYDRLVSQNYFRLEYVHHLTEDLSLIQATFSRLLPGHPISLVMQRTWEAQRILTMQEEARDHLKDCIRKDDLDEITNIFNSLQLSVLSLGECEKIINLVRN